MADRTLMGWLLVLALAGSGRAADDLLTPEQEKRLQRAKELNTEAGRLYQQAQYASAVERLHLAAGGITTLTGA